MEKINQPKVLSVLTLAMISVAGIVNLRNLPILASVGFSLVFFCTIAAVVFLIPSALVCAEMASSFPQAGGVYLWTEKAFGAKIGFFTIWSEWFNNVIGFPTTLSFIAATLAFIFIPNLEQHKVAMFVAMQVIIWGCTLFNFLGIKASSRLNIVGALAGTIIPATFIVILGCIWLLNGHPIQLNLSLSNLLPPMHITNIVFFLGVLSGYAGMQITAFHAPNVKNPRTDFPRSIILAVFMILAITILSSLAIALVVPQNQLSLVSGVVSGFATFFYNFHLNWALPILALLIAISGISSLSAWLLGPARGLAVAAHQGYFPKWCAYENRHGAPTNILLLQAILTSALSLLFLFTQSLSTAFWILMVLTSQFTLVMYVLMFGAAIRLRYSHPNIPRPFRIAGGNFGIWLIGGVGISVCLIGISIGYFPPASLNIGKLWKYETLLIAGNLLYIVLPLIIYRVNLRSQIS
jgi:amino acid transporter